MHSDYDLAIYILFRPLKNLAWNKGVGCCSLLQGLITYQWVDLKVWLVSLSMHESIIHYTEFCYKELIEIGTDPACPVW